MSNLQELITVIGGVSVATGVIVYLGGNLISTRLKESVKNEYLEARESVKNDFQIQLQNLKNELLIELEKEKLKHSFILQRNEEAKQVISQLTEYCYNVAFDLSKPAIREVANSASYKEAPSSNEKNSLLIEFVEGSVWAEWRQGFQALRSKLEYSNEVLSRYSIQMETILHSKTMKEIIQKDYIQELGKKIKHDDYRYILSSTWRLIGDCLSALGKITTYDERFWMLPDSKENYGRRLDEWVRLEREHIVDTLKQFSSAKSMCNWKIPETSPKNFIFYMKIEEDDGINEFWNYVNGESS